VNKYFIFNGIVSRIRGSVLSSKMCRISGRINTGSGAYLKILFATDKKVVLMQNFFSFVPGIVPVHFPWYPCLEPISEFLLNPNPQKIVDPNHKNVLISAILIKRCFEHHFLLCFLYLDPKLQAIKWMKSYRYYRYSREKPVLWIRIRNVGSRSGTRGYGSGPAPDPELNLNLTKIIKNFGNLITMKLKIN
jgi:hypothetical protein